LWSANEKKGKKKRIIAKRGSGRKLKDLKTLRVSEGLANTTGRQGLAVGGLKKKRGGNCGVERIGGH